ncbi:FAD-binding molybdopterin dehydrogenase [Methylobacterium sp. Leaf94]|uniref:xanthine dehydrogenase small subunit n=1 Tax=Methylobacterium sp. Leaf94 TaxID=1736250 RepID=UPI0006F7B1A4|nr:xanthine dehydrogenase small subunit [Methylobacterium sp. Leaf94]KQU24201.1 FAD-binding molybdopterin dehydrogenase [Methylobacterium sp. Leaf94]
MRHAIRFLLGPEVRTIEACDPTLTVLDWLRGPERLIGTKEGCNEGDCGACTVVVVRPEGPSGAERLRYRAVDACITFLGMLDGCQLLTVEHLRGADGTLHPVQRLMVEEHGSQCGFCTPGFVMSLFAMTKDSPTKDLLAETGPLRTSASPIDDALAGNLCRCTGYAPIVRAAERALAAPEADTFDAAHDATLARLLALRDDETVAVSGPKGRFFAPATVPALVDLMAEYPQATIVAGATDVALWVTKGLRVLDPVIWLGRVRSLRVVGEGPDHLYLGAGVSLSEAGTHLAGLHPDLGELFRRHGAAQTRNAGTLGGNIANGSPIGDAAPALIALGASLHLIGRGSEREIPLEDFFVAYGRQDLRPGEFVAGVRVPKLGPETVFRAYKISKRFDEDISAVLGAFRLTVDAGTTRQARIAYGGMAGTPKRAVQAEAALMGQSLDPAVIPAFKAAVARDFTPLSDMRASAAYRLKVAGNLIERLIHEAAPEAPETRLATVGAPAHA